MTGPALVVKPTPLLAPRFGLLNSVPPVSTDGDRWELGIKWTNEPACITDGTDTHGTFDPCDTEFEDDPAGMAGGEFQPFGIYVAEQCSTFGEAAEDLNQRMTRALNAKSSYLVENEFWYGTQAQASSWANLFLTHMGSDALNDAGPIEALGAIDSAMAQHTSARTAIYCTPKLLAYWVSAGLLRREGALWLSPVDSIVIPGSGWFGDDGSTGGDDYQFAYATPVPDVRLGPVTVLGPAPNQLATSNTRLVVASRVAAVTFDDCYWVKQGVNLCSTVDCTETP